MKSRSAARFPSLLIVGAAVLAALVLGLCLAKPLAAAIPPPDVASYQIAARYDPDTHRITADETAVYRNLTNSPMPSLMFHLYLNAFRNEGTLWMQEAGFGHRGFAYDADHPGWIEVREVRLSDGTALALSSPDADATLAEASLPRAIAPGESVTVTLSFEAQLPRVFARTGWGDGGDFVMAGQWFPKLGVWEDGAWNAHPFHANSEFYADFGSYAVDLTLPAGWVVGSSGVPSAAPRPDTDGWVKHALSAEHVIDFAWAASPHFEELTADLDEVDLRVLAYSDQRTSARRVLDATADAYALYSEWIGPYGQGLYPQITVILVPPDSAGAGGMEYPTLFTVGAMGGGGQLRCFRMLEVEAVHELGHQWFQSVVATNEAESPWLDEGFTDYLTNRAMEQLYSGAVSSCGGWSYDYLGLRRMEYRLWPDVTMAGTAWDFGTEYSVATYSKPVLALTTLERLVGEPAMIEFLGAYYARHAFTHPREAEVQRVMAETLGDEIADWFFADLVYGSGAIDMRYGGESSAADEEAPVIVTLMRDGELCVPSSVSVDTAQGKGPSETPWPCPGEVLPIVTGEPTAVIIDSELDVALDQNWANNGWRRTPDWGGWLGVLVRLGRFIQGILWGGPL